MVRYATLMMVGMLAVGCVPPRRVAALEEGLAALTARVAEVEAEAEADRAVWRGVAEEVGALSVDLDAVRDDIGAQAASAARLDIILEQTRERVHALAARTDLWRQHVRSRVATLERRAGVVPPDVPRAADGATGAPPAAVELARAHLAAAEYPEARAVLAPLVEVSTGAVLAEVQYLRGLAWFEEGMAGQAVTVLHELLASQPPRPWRERATLVQARALVSLGQPASAHVLLSELVGDDAPDDVLVEARALLKTLDERG